MASTKPRILSESVIYHFEPDLTPAWRIEPGENIQVQCPDGMHGAIQSESDLYKAVDPDHVNDAVGPIFVNGAEQGDTLAVVIERIHVPVNQGYVLLIPGFGLLQERVSYPKTKICKIRDNKVIFNALAIDMRPCIGTIGVAPAHGRISTIYPGDHGGNLDTTEIREGVTLFLPVNVPGGLLAMGDGKAVMGDGEVCGTGVGVPLHIDLTCGILKGVTISRPVIEAEDAWMTIGSAPTLEEAVKLATSDLIALLQRSQHLSFEDSYMLVSLIGNLKISQVVDPWMTVRMSIAKEHLSHSLL